MDTPQTIVVGIDGATFDLIDPWVEEGKLPNFEKFLTNGARCELTTTYPPLTGPAWVSFMTGCNPGKHGVYDFLTGDPESEDVINYRSIKQPTVWDLMNRKGVKQGLINVPVTFPPPEIDGHIVSGPLSSSDPGKACHPSGLIESLENETGREWWHRTSSGFTPSKPLKYFESHYEDNKTIGEYTLRLLEKHEYDFFIVLFDLVDSISHFFWHYMDESHPYHEKKGDNYRDAILKAYQHVDAFLDQLHERTGDNTNVVLMSDHGFGPTEYMVNLNNFFQDEGLLQLKNSPITVLKRTLRGLGVTPKRLVKIAETVGLDFLAFMLPKSLRNKIIGTMGSYSDVDWDRTVCYSRGHMGQVHLAHRLKENADIYEKKRQQVAEILRERPRHPKTGEPLVTNLKFREELYEGPYLDDAPDIFVEMMNFRCVSYPLFSGGSELFVPHIQEGRYANHRMNGIFCGKGPSFEESIRLNKTSIMDLAPTLLYLQDLPIQETMDGALIEEAIRDQLLEERTPTYTNYDLSRNDSTGSGPDEAMERLKGLGYLG